MTWQQLSSNAWRADLDALVDTIMQRHRNPFHTTSQSALEQRIQALHMRLASLDSSAIIVAFARLLAQIGDGHTRLRLPGVVGFQRFPVQLYNYQDGCGVQATTPSHANLLGTRVVSIDDTPIDVVWAQLRPVISHDNAMGVLAQGAQLACIPEVLHGCGVITAPDQATITGIRPDGERVTVTLNAAEALPEPLTWLWDNATEPIPLWRARPASANWWIVISETATLYAHYGSVQDRPEQSLTSWFTEIFARIEQGDIQRLVIDIRRNGGGNMALNQPLLHHLIRCNRINQWGRLFVIIGRGTFSAAMLLAVDIEKHTQALFVGEPTGSRPNAYGENVIVHLPHSQLEISVSGLWWQHGHPADDRPWIAPTIRAALSLADDQRNHDPAIAAIDRYTLQAKHIRDYHQQALAWLGL